MGESIETTLYGLARSVYTRIARLGLEEKGVAYHLEEVEIFGREGVPAGHLQRHPFGRIPVLCHGDFVLYETAAISRYVDESFSGIRLQPENARERARMTQIIGLLDSYAYHPMVWSVFVQRMRVPAEGGQSDESVVARGLERSRLCLLELQRLQGDRPFLCGPDMTLADLHAYPMLRYLALAPEGAELVAGFPMQSQWLARMSSRPSARRTRGIYEQAVSA